MVVLIVQRSVRLLPSSISRIVVAGLSSEPFRWKVIGEVVDVIFTPSGMLIRRVCPLLSGYS